MRLSSFLFTVMVTAASLAPVTLASSGCAAGYVYSDGWAFLGERRVVGRGQEVREAIAGLRNDGRWTQIRFRVTDAPLIMDDVIVTFGDGEQWRPGVRLEFNPGTQTRDIGLPNGPRILRRVDFFMHNIPGDGHAHVELLAR
jgi:hypothetical protein